MNKRWLRALEKIFAAEVSGAVVFQSDAKVFKELANLGYLQFREHTMHFNDGLPPLIVGGPYLTHVGRLVYCESCADAAGK